MGAGAIGQTVGRILAGAGHDMTVSWSSSAAHLHLAAAHIGFATRTPTPADAVKDADAELFAPRFEHVEPASRAMGMLAGEFVIDTTNPYNPQTRQPR